MVLFFQQLVNGIMLGAAYSLVALGLTLIYGILHIPNFAHGHKYMWAAFTSLFLVVNFHTNYWVSLVIAMVVLGFVGAGVERLVYRPLRNAPHINSFIAAIGLLLFLESLSLIFWGADFRRFPTLYDKPIHIFGVAITLQRLLVIVAAALFIILLQVFIKRTWLGATIEAVAQNPEGAQLVGISIDRVSSLTFGIGTSLAAAAATLIAPIFLVYPTMGAMPNLKAFVVIIIGGMGSIPGAVIGGLMLGLMEALGGGYISTDYKDLFAFGALVTFLTFRPTGLFGKGVR
ncbi:MAG: amino acid/amide transporter rane protein 1, family [Deltaproteobacteria bacterium]|jgi:branched-chain amino acid transport system permease protein|nr:amino acid/amide transporter rane protein 1, family [Deltaproteobacteria bacterium]